MTPEARLARAQLGQSTNKFGRNSPEARQARETFEAERFISRVIEAVNKSHPELTPEQSERLSQAILASGLVISS